jgi:3-hydroxyacyl-CoA dehydrogenase / enoyl-CoA hydratase / 3-hydroxybutyryl-CoA epimerase
MTVSDCLTITLDESGVAILTMDVVERPMNLVTPGLQDALARAIDTVTSDPSIKGAIITSAKADFLAGGDLRAILDRMALGLSARELFDISRKFGELLRKLETCGKPFVAAINGIALGGGFELALACHHRVVADLPKLVVGLPEVTVGLMPGAGATQRLPRMLGAAAAVPILLQGKTFKPADALQAGLVDEVAAPEDLLKAARNWILAGGNPVQPWDRKGYVPPGGAALGDPDLGQLYSTTATAIARDTQHNRPAPIAILTAVARGLPLPFDAGMRVETRQFVLVFRDPTARNIIRTQFFNKAAADNLARRPVGPAPRTFERIGIVGAGLMGSGIALVSSLAGLQVTLLDSSAEIAAKGKSRAAAAAEKLVSRGAVSRESADAALQRIGTTGEYNGLAGCELIIEAVFENREVKLDVLKKAHAAAGDNAIYASNTSTIPITTLASTIGRADRFLGMHFFSPVERMALVEVIRGKQTSDTTLAHALDFVKRIRKTPIVVNDSRGFFTSRLFSPYLAEALAMVAEGVNPALIENGARQAGFPIGPLANVDITTLELAYAAANQTRRDLGDAWVPQPSYPVQKMFVEVLDRKGKRYGKGFYDYPADAPKRLWPGISDVYPRKPVQPSVEEVGQRLLFRQALEAVRCLEEGVITDVVDGDVGSTLGIGFPAHTGGVFTLIDSVGVARFVEICDRFADAYGERWRPTKGLRDRAVANESFYPQGAATSSAG